MRNADKNQFLKRRAIILAVVWILLLVISLSFLSFLASLFGSNPQSQSFASLSWAGYLISNDFAVPPIQITGINASWTVPTVNPSSSDTYSSSWIGIGGQNDKTLIQAGTEQNSVNGDETYYAWYELLPNFSVAVDEIDLAPGDSFAVSITLANNQTNQWLIQMRDATNGQGFIKTVTYNSSRLSGEWIMERPHVNKMITSLADFGSVTFSSCYITVNNVIGSLGNFKYSLVNMANQADTALASVLPVASDGTSFRVDYLASN